MGAVFDDEDDDIIVEELRPDAPLAVEDDDLVIEEVTPGRAGAAGLSTDLSPSLVVDKKLCDDDDLIIEEVSGVSSGVDTDKKKDVPLDDDEDDDLIIEELPGVSSGVNTDEKKDVLCDDDDDDLIVEEVSAGGVRDKTKDVPDDDDDEDDDDLMIEEVTATGVAEESEDEDDDVVIIEEVSAPEVTGEGRFSTSEDRAPPSMGEMRELADAKRAEGNAEFERKLYKAAKARYGEAVEMNPYDHKAYSNRSACYAELGEFESAREDAWECVRLAPEFVKGYFRLARACRLSGAFDEGEDAARRGLERGGGAQLREELRLLRRSRRREARRRGIQRELGELAAEMTPEERRWKAWWGGQGHPTLIDNSNLDRYIPDSKVDVSYDAQVTQELRGPDNLPRLDDFDDDDDEDDVLLEDVLARLAGDADALPLFEDAGMGPRSLLTCSRLVPTALDEVLRSAKIDAAAVSALADAQARDCLRASWTADSAFPDDEGLFFAYPDFSWRQRVRDVELRVLLPMGCSASDLDVTLEPRRLRIAVRKSGLRFWPYVRNTWTTLADVGPRLPPREPASAGDRPAGLDDDDDVAEELDPIEFGAAQPTSAVEAFREAAADEAEFEEAPFVEELVERRFVRIRWIEDGVELRSAEVEASSRDELAARVAETFQLPPELQRLETPEGDDIDDDDLPAVVLVSEKPSPPPDDIVLLDKPFARKIHVDSSIWHISKPDAIKGLALQGPILVFHLFKFQTAERGTPLHAGQLYWPRLFLETPCEDNSVLHKVPNEFYKHKGGH